MIPKIIHLCWFSNDPFPVEIKVCLDTWKRILPDFQVKHWTYQDAKAIGCQFINEALSQEMGFCCRCSPFLCCIQRRRYLYG